MQPFRTYGCLTPDMPSTLSPVAVLSISANGPGRNLSELSEPVFGGYANARGEVVLFGKELAYRVNFKKQTVQQRPQLNPGAQARYDATNAGEPFEYATKTFQRLSNE